MTDTLTFAWQGQNFISSNDDNIGSPYHITGTNMTVDWGDGTTGTITANQKFTHTYSSSGTYTITITGDSITSLGQSCFAYCAGLKSITIPSSITSLSSYCFNNCTSLKSVIIPSSITSFGEGCFYYCTDLKSITIPSSVTSFGAVVFYYCNGLTSIIFTRPTPPNAQFPSTFRSIPTSCKIYVPKGNLSAYTSASNYPSSSTYTYIERDMIEMEKAQIIAREIFNKLYPIGAIYMTVENNNPEDLFGGAWEQIQDKFLLACGDTYANLSTGGSANAVNVSHTHNLVYEGELFCVDTSSADTNTGLGTGNLWQNANKHIGQVATAGENGVGKNMPPYITVNIWRRIA